MSRHIVDMRLLAGDIDRGSAGWPRGADGAGLGWDELSYDQP